MDKVKQLLVGYCQSEWARSTASDLRVHTRKDYIDTALRQSHEYHQLLLNSSYFPNDYILNLARELKMLGIPGAVLTGEDFLQLRKLAESIEKIFRWFDADRRTAYGALAKVIEDTHYEKKI